MCFEKLKDLINDCATATKTVWLLLLAILSMLLFAILLFVIVNSVQGLSGKHFEIILTFVGVIGTFVVVTNFHQAEEMKHKFDKEVKLINKEYVQFVGKYQPMLDAMMSSDEYRLAEDMVAQQGKDDCRWLIYHKCLYPRFIGEAYTNSNVYIVEMTFEDESLFIKFEDPMGHFYTYPNNVVSIKKADVFDSREVRLDNPMFQSYIRSMLQPNNITQAEL